MDFLYLYLIMMFSWCLKASDKVLYLFPDILFWIPRRFWDFYSTFHAWEEILQAWQVLTSKTFVSEAWY